MPVFNAFFKVIRRNIPSMMIYLGVFLVIALFLARFADVGQQAAGFSAEKPRVAVFNDDGSALSKGLAAYLGQNATLVTLPDNQTALQDALFYRNVVYIVRIPAGFTQSFLSGGNARLDKTAVPASADGAQMDFLINRYLSLASLYSRSLPNASTDEIASSVAGDLKHQTTVRIADTTPVPNDSLFRFFNALAYSIMAIMIIGIGSIMMVFRNDDLKKRNTCAPVKSIVFNLQLVLGSLGFGLLLWAVMAAAAFAFYGLGLLQPAGLLLLLNSLVFTLCCLCVALIAGFFIKNHNVMNATANVLSLGLSFISGVFVPQWLLGDGVRRAASFTPVYWYVRAANELQNLSSFSVAALRPYTNCLFIQLGFAAALLAVALVLARQKQLHAA